jgi:hypothetical protein
MAATAGGGCLLLLRCGAGGCATALRAAEAAVLAWGPFEC